MVSIEKKMDEEDQNISNKISIKIREDGLLGLVQAVPRYIYSNFLRNHLLTHKNPVSFNGIESPYKASVFDRVVPGYSLENKPAYEDAEIDAVRKYTEKGDKVVIVGGGRGITPTAAANSVGEKGHVIAYEASVDRISRARKTVQHNQVSDIVDLHHSIIGRAESVAGEIGSASALPPDELPTCDFLELDCEGAEEQILEEMTISPRVISVETHETMGASHSNVLSMLDDRGYNIKEETDKTDRAEGIRHVVAVLED